MLILLCRILLFLQDALNTLGDQSLERTLDDSAIRRILIPDMFLLADAILTIFQVNKHNFSFYSQFYICQLSQQL